MLYYTHPTRSVILVSRLSLRKGSSWTLATTPVPRSGAVRSPHFRNPALALSGRQMDTRPRFTCPGRVELELLEFTFTRVATFRTPPFFDTAYTSSPLNCGLAMSFFRENWKVPVAGYGTD